MTKFLVLYRAPTSAREQMANASPEQKQEGMEAWMAWAQKVGAAAVDLGAPLGEGASVGEGTSDDVVGFSIVEAESQDAAGQLMSDHPHLHTPDGTITVHEFLSTPGM